MKPNQAQKWVALAIGLLSGVSAMAGLPADQVARLGKDLTPVGAEAAANKDGSIPAWSGGLTKAPAGFSPAMGYVDPYPSDKPLYTITAANAEQHKDKLTPGQMALLKRYPTYKMLVYPTRRSAGYPAKVYDAIKSEASRVELSADGNAVLNANATPVPFPVPKSGLEAVYNVAFRYRADTLRRNVVEFPVQVNGAFTPVRRQEDFLFKQAMPDEPNSLWKFKATYTAPSSIAGEVVMVHDYIDLNKQPRAAWVYNPGARRVLRAPEIAYDTPRTGTDGLGTMDDYDGFQGAPDRYDWKLLGKREMFISYNNYKLASRSLKYTDIIRPQVINQDLPRYELHRVWVVEATLKQGKSHIYGKRILFLDEDSWQVAHEDLYDTRGELWRIYEQYSMQFYDVPSTWSAGAVSYDLQSRRYVASAFFNEEPPTQFNFPLKATDFTTSALRRQGD